MLSSCPQSRVATLTTVIALQRLLPVADAPSLYLSRSPFSFSLAAKCRQGLAFICMAIAGALWFYRFLVLFHIHAGVSCPALLLPSLPLWLLFVVLLLLFALLCSPCPGCTSFCKLFRRHQHFAAGI